MRGMGFLNWLLGDQWTCECHLNKPPGRHARVKFTVELGSQRFSQYVDADDPDPVSVVVEEIRAAAPNRDLYLSPRSLRKLRAVVEKAYFSSVSSVFSARS